LMYLFERSLKAVHEYQADDKMLIGGENPVNYQQMIMNQLFSTNIFTLNNAFSGSSLIKKRMIMMTKKRSGKFAGLKLLLVLPLILMFFMGFSCKSENIETLLPAEEIKEGLETKSLTGELETKELKDVLEKEQIIVSYDFKTLDIVSNKEVLEEKEIFVVVEEMPTFMGGDVNKFREWVQRNVQYPPVARENGIQGKVFVMFVVREDGSVSDAQIIRGVDPSLDDETLRVVNSSPAWAPGKQRGVCVNVRYSISVNYQLQ
ncbi:MAG TPA: M56 family metallopeptidase, partial [Bacteroidales bacterium]|nr:M56 family metallopeptidase [Bacteroidales bacterium]